MLNPSAIKLTDKIGKGCQGVVYKGKNVDSDQFYAVKILNINHMKKKEK